MQTMASGAVSAWLSGCGPAVVGVLWDAEDRCVPVGSVDDHACDQCFDEGFALVRGAAGDDLGEVVGDVASAGARNDVARAQRPSGRSRTAPSRSPPAARPHRRPIAVATRGLLP
jgi:hypothetical protein